MTKKELWELCKVKNALYLKCDSCYCNLHNKYSVVILSKYVDSSNYPILICETCFKK